MEASSALISILDPPSAAETSIVKVSNSATSMLKAAVRQTGDVRPSANAAGSSYSREMSEEITPWNVVRNGRA